MINKFEGKYRFLSNFYPCEIEYQGIKYPSVEHYYVAMKVNDDQLIDGRTYTSADVREYIAKISTAGEVKRFGRNKIKIRKDWNDVRLKVMNWGVREKFTKHENLKELLLSTTGDELIEGNYWHDVFFGVCECKKCNNKGENHLGRILMDVRNKLQGR